MLTFCMLLKSKSRFSACSWLRQVVFCTISGPEVSLRLWAKTAWNYALQLRAKHMSPAAYTVWGNTWDTCKDMSNEMHHRILHKCVRVIVLPLLCVFLSGSRPCTMLQFSIEAHAARTSEIPQPPPSAASAAALSLTAWVDEVQEEQSALGHWHILDDAHSHKSGTSCVPTHNLNANSYTRTASRVNAKVFQRKTWQTTSKYVWKTCNLLVALSPKRWCQLVPGRTPQAQNVHFQDLVPAHFVHFVAGAISEKMMPASAGPNPPSSKSAFPRLSAGKEKTT